MKTAENMEPVSLARLAREALRDDNGNVELAINALHRRLTRDADLLRQILRSALMDAVSARVRDANRSKRSAILYAIAAPTRDNVVALARGMSAAILDMPLMNGMKLRDAKRDDVQRAADFYATQAKDMGRKGRWLALIAQSTPPDCTVGDAITEDRARELYEESRS